MARAAAGGVDKGDCCSANPAGRRVGLGVAGRSGALVMRDVVGPCKTLPSIGSTVGVGVVTRVGTRVGVGLDVNHAVGECVGVSEGLGDRSGLGNVGNIVVGVGMRVAGIFLGAFVPIITVGVAVVGAWVSVAVLGPRFGVAARPARTDIYVCMYRYISYIHLYNIYICVSVSIYQSLYVYTHTHTHAHAHTHICV